MAGLNNPSTVAVIDETLKNDVSLLKQKVAQDEIDTAQRTDYFEQRAAGLIQDVNAKVSAQVPVYTIDSDTVITNTMQRVVHLSEDDHTLTLPVARDIYERRNIIKNGNLGGKLTVLGSFVMACSADMTECGDIELGMSEGFETLGYFMPIGGGSEIAPDDFRMNNQIMAGIPGEFMIAVVTFQEASYSRDETNAKFALFLNRISALENMQTVLGGKQDSLEVSLNNAKNWLQIDW